MSKRTLIHLSQLACGAALLAAAALAIGQPTFGNPSPTAGSTTSQKANASADQALYKPVEYTNGNKKGPALVVIPGEIKSNNATFLQKFTANNIADFGEVELSAANFQVLERSNLGPLLNEFTSLRVLITCLLLLPIDCAKEVPLTSGPFSLPVRHSDSNPNRAGRQLHRPAR